MENRKRINYNEILPDYATSVISSESLSTLKRLSRHLRKECMTGTNNYLEYLKNTGVALSRLDSKLTAKEKAIVEADLLCSNNDIRNFMFDNSNDDLFVALGTFFSSVLYVRRELQKNPIPLDVLSSTSASFANNYAQRLTTAFADFLGVPEELVHTEALINKINCIYSYSRSTLYRNEGSPSYHGYCRKRNGQ